MDTDEWRKNREVLLCTLRDLEAGRPTEETIETVKQKLAKLDAKFHDESDASRSTRSEAAPPTR